MDALEISGLLGHRREAERFEVGVRAGQERLAEDPVVQDVVGLRCSAVGVVVGSRRDPRVVVGETDLAGTGPVQHLRGSRVGDQLVMCGGQRVEEQAAPRRQASDPISLQRGHGRLVQGVPVLDAVPQAGDDVLYAFVEEPVTLPSELAVH